VKATRIFRGCDLLGEFHHRAEEGVLLRAVAVKLRDLLPRLGLHTLVGEGHRVGQVPAGFPVGLPLRSMIREELP